jgi:hypothetical protein
MDASAWRNTLRAIRRGEVIPVIGPDLVVLGEADGGLPLYDYLAWQLVDRLGMDPTNLDRYSLIDVATDYLTHRGATRLKLCEEITDILESRSWPTPEPLRQLAQIRHFNLFVTTTFDPFMERALNEVRFGGAPRTTSRKYSLRRPHQDAPGDGATTDSPVVYHLFGQPDTLNDYAVTEDDVLHFSHNLQAGDKRPENLFEQLHRCNLLMLGWNFPGWLTRFFMSAVAGPRMFDGDTPLGVLADDGARRDRAMTLFLGRGGLTMYETEGGAVRFVEELHKRWTEEFGAAAVVDDGGSAKPSSAAPLSRFIFISYAREDLESARRIEDRLKSAGVEVWFDQKALQAGAKYENEIKARIADCEFFLPVISRSTNTGESFFWKEWNWAISRTAAQSKDRRFILPVIVDETPEQAGYLPDEFKGAHMERASGGVLSDGFVESMKQYIRNKARAEQGLEEKDSN